MSDTCKKCGGSLVTVVYERATDTLRKSCSRCGHYWWEPPLDRKEVQP